ncbi:MAG: hypothetical protein JWS11_2243 [Cypionkella sp.]|nr:hypothetical protein [Cypionkella sp.]
MVSHGQFNAERNVRSGDDDHEAAQKRYSSEPRLLAPRRYPREPANFWRLRACGDHCLDVPYVRSTASTNDAQSGQSLGHFCVERAEFVGITIV